MTMPSRRQLVGSAAFALAAGVAYPFGELWWKCRPGVSASEACVWARAYFPLSRWIEPVVVAPIVFVLALFLCAVTG